MRYLTADLGKNHRLVIEQGVQRIGNQRLSHFRFRHVLFQTYLYHSQGKVERAYRHEMVGTKLEAVCGGDTEQFTEHLAQHFQEADLRDKAIHYRLQAGKRAVRLSAHEEAIAHFTQALALLGTVPENAERDTQEFHLRVELGISLLSTRGWPAPETEAAYARAYELAQQIPYKPTMSPALSGLYRTYVAIHTVKGGLAQSLIIGEECLRLAQARNEPMLYMAAHAVLGPSLYHVGKLEKAYEHTEQGRRDYEYQRRSSHIVVHGLDMGVHCLNYAAHMRWTLGYPDQALQHGQTALALAKAQSHPFSVVVASCYLAMLYQFLSDRQGVQEQANAALVLCTQYEFVYYRGWATFLLGWALTQQGEIEVGITQMEHGLHDLRAMRTGLRFTYYLALLAEAYAIMGQVEKGLSLLDDAMAWMEEHEERYYEAELHRLRGKLLLQRATQAQEETLAEVEECFHTAVAVAWHQQAKSLELRATVSLCRFWQAHGRLDLAYTRLAETYGWFTEGFNMPDLMEAKSLLAELASQ